MFDHDFDRAIGAIERRQQGVFHAQQAHDAGGSKDMLQTRLRTGMFVRLAPRVLAVASHPATWQRQFKAAERDIPGSALADQSAAVIHQLHGFRVTRPRLVVPTSASNRSSLAVVRRSPSRETTTIDRMRVTTLRQTLFDLLACSPLALVERAIDASLTSRRVTVDALMRIGESASRSRLPNSATWRALVEERSAQGWQPPESELEVRLDRVLRRLPAGVSVLRQGTPPWWHAAEHRVDVYILEWALIVEADGRRWHTRVADFDRDRWRDNTAAAFGHRVVRFTHTHLTQQPDDALDLLVQAGRHSTSLATAG